jgi:hypothetical protein
MKKNKHKLSNETISNETILNALIESCINFNPKLLKPYVLSEKIVTDMPNKIRFYKFFKHMLLSAKEKSEGQISLKIEKPNWENDKSLEYYNLYDSVHKHSRLSIIVKETKDKIFLDVMPF